MPGLQRKYRGDIYYKIDLAYTLTQDKTEKTTKIIRYSFRPGSGILSYIIGFIDTGFLVKKTNDFASTIEQIVRENKIVEQRIQLR